MPSGSEERDYGKCCIFLSRSCGAVASILVLLCGFITLLPLPSLTSGSYGRCVAVGLIMIVTAVVMFFLEASVLGYCVDKLAFLLTISKYMKHWMRAILYMVLAFVPLVLWCLSATTLIGLGIMFMIGALNFVLAIGQKGSHDLQLESYSRMKLSDLGRLDDGEPSEESSLDEKGPIARESNV